MIEMIVNLFVLLFLGVLGFTLMTIFLFIAATLWVMIVNVGPHKLPTLVKGWFTRRWGGSDDS